MTFQFKIRRRFVSIACTLILPLVCVFLFVVSSEAANVSLVGTNSGSLVHNGTTKVDILDPNNDNTINVVEWGLAPTVVGPPTGVGFYNDWNGQNWARVVDNNTGSKVCCNFNPGSTSVTFDSATSAYSLSGYSVSTGNDSASRRPTGWRLYGSDDGFVSSNVLIDTVTPTNINGGSGWTANQQVGEVVLPSNTAGYSSFRMVFDENADTGVAANGGPFQISEIELIGTLAPLEIGGNNKVGSFEPPTTSANVAGGARFVRVSEDSVVDGNLHISEIEVFNVNLTPNEAGPASANGNPNLSTNDYSTSLSHDAATTTSSTQHGSVTSVYDGSHQSGGSVWSTSDVADSRFTLDLGGSRGVGTVRVYPRNDNCCSERFENLTFDVFADDGSGGIGALLGSYTDNTPDGASLVMQEANFNIPFLGADILGTLASDHSYVFELDASTGTMDLLSVTNPDINLYNNTLLDLNDATAIIEVINGDADPGMYQMLLADEILGQFSDIILPDGMKFNLDELYTTGMIGVAAIPEPSTMLLAMLGLVSMGFVAVRKRKR